MNFRSSFPSHPFLRLTPPASFNSSFVPSANSSMAASSCAPTTTLSILIICTVWSKMSRSPRSSSAESIAMPPLRYPFSSVRNSSSRASSAVPSMPPCSLPNSCTSRMAASTRAISRSRFWFTSASQLSMASASPLCSHSRFARSPASISALMPRRSPSTAFSIPALVSCAGVYRYPFSPRCIHCATRWAASRFPTASFASCTTGSTLSTR